MENLTRQKVEVKIRSRELDSLSWSLYYPKMMVQGKDNDPFLVLSVPNRLQATEASRKSLCHEQFVVRGKSRSTEEQIADPCRRRVA